MILVSTQIVVQAVREALSAARLATYEGATGRKGDEDISALTLYAWNAQVSGALLAPLHLCEVVVRNAVANAIEAQYGARWPWSPGFERSLPDPRTGYSPLKDLQNARRGAGSAGKVIPELKFVFWQKMFTSRYDGRLWGPHLLRVLPNLQKGKAIGQLRQEIYNELEQIRKLRNRIAHHEPIFTRNLQDDFHKICSLVESRCSVSAAWLAQNQMALSLIQAKP
ncbi:hypothetical protein SAMN03159444_02258 [Pseudomonas sp. NFACC02]|nr:hypothetical protein SAMN03159444_02258 [Pseudomonas sp. NFACC02]